MELRGSYYPDLVRVFYFNLKVHNGIFHTRVKGVDIVLDNDIWTNVAHIPVLPNSQLIPSDFTEFNKVMSIMYKAKRLDSTPLSHPLLVSHIYGYKGIDVSSERAKPVLPNHKIGDNSLRQMGFIKQGNSYIHSDDCYYGDRGIVGSSLVRLRKCSEEKIILREVFEGSVSSFVKTQRRCKFISCGIKKGGF
ncbi:hypothetical protein LR48_Vigan11g164000 [Vigna angularis]|uniref:Uncharacterized protein n=1 Tax=Phaseolus angularis TaxID=3914 RepID=A0A0L9VU43_PHAAN|nr:hypothetical protein LR48_Vigan11g164000 [Vigna angularis]